MFSSTFRCVICLKDIVVRGYSPWIEQLYFWIPRGSIYIYPVTLEKDDKGEVTMWEEHFLCVCPKDTEYINKNKVVGEALIEARLSGTKKD